MIDGAHWARLEQREPTRANAKHEAVAASTGRSSWDRSADPGVHGFDDVLHWKARRLVGLLGQGLSAVLEAARIDSFAAAD
jgi:hypothetical protein